MSTEESLFLEIQRKARSDAKVKRSLDAEVEKVKAAWVRNSPVDSGKYAASIEIKDRDDVDGFPAKRIVATDPKAKYIEFGTGVWNPRRQGGNSPAFAPRAKTAAEFGGDESGVDV
jgi:hypothetical protein